jgi:DNA-binding HxlR family transcriptional regulator
MPKSSRVASTKTRRSSCPIACALDLIGDRWTLLIVRDLFFGKTRYGEFIESPERIPTNILADRLVKLEATGMIRSILYQTNPPRNAYTLTVKGSALKPVLGMIAEWGTRYVPGVRANEKIEAALRAR